MGKKKLIIEEGFQKGAVPICVFCSHPWSDNMVDLEARNGSGGCETCGHGGEGSYKLEIKCENCKKLIYIKEGLIY